MFNVKQVMTWIAVSTLTTVAIATEVNSVPTSAPAEATAEYFTLGGYKVTEIPVEQVDAVLNANVLKTQVTVPSADLNPFAELSFQLDNIVNFGTKVWSLIEKGQPVVNLQLQTANALPQGLTTSNELAGWQDPNASAYSIEYQNLYGMTVVRFDFKLSFIAGGSYNGKGKYIINATVIPAKVDVAWGFTFNAAANVPAVFNTGTKEDPVSGMQLQIKWDLSTALKHTEQTESFYISGDNTFKKL
ncbi:MAG: hypothetical protein ACOYOK_02975 [Pseudobdellovibrionaceae bacterium]